MPPIGRQNDLHGESNFSEKKRRQRFGYDEDYLLIIQVKIDTPYSARHGAIGETWDMVAARLNEHPDFQMRPIKGTTAKTRFETLVHRHRKWMKSDNIQHVTEVENPFRKIMTELVQQLDLLPKGNAQLNEADDDERNDSITTESRTRIRLGKRRRSEAFEPPVRQDIFRLPRDQMQVLPDAIPFPAAQVTFDGTEPSEEPHPLPQSPIARDVVTVQQAMAELLKMQHAFATRPYQANVMELEKINEARLREEEEKTKQRSLELQIEMQRTRQRQLELDFEKDERKKDREEQVKLIASLVQCLKPKAIER
ncbi:unnamed protein product [Peronospora destructor]|uniref:Myb-like domain-containing protein n=1 Tax=Peronospora destructor TaxID=86335 RepID=A0AAV0UUP1_9STRA|nr:unnamed protein product [Peronospora destructor]